MKDKLPPLILLAGILAGSGITLSSSPIMPLTGLAVLFTWIGYACLVVTYIDENQLPASSGEIQFPEPDPALRITTSLMGLAAAIIWALALAEMTLSSVKLTSYIQINPWLFATLFLGVVLAIWSARNLFHNVQKGDTHVR